MKSCLWILFVMLGSGLALAGDGPGAGSRGGSDMLAGEMRTIKEFLEGDLGRLAAAFLGRQKLGDAETSAPRARLQEWVAAGLPQALEHHKLQLSGPCPAGTDRNWSASTEKCGPDERTILGRPICFDTYRLATEAATRRTLIATLFHEIGHQFCLPELAAQQMETFVSRAILNEERATVPGGLQDWDENDDKTLFSSLEPGSVFRATQTLKNFGFSMVIIDDGDVLANLGEVRPGSVYCEIPTVMLHKGLRLKKDYIVSSVSGPWSSNHGRTTLRSMWLMGPDGPLEVLCERSPDRGPELTQREVLRTLRGTFRFEGHSKLRNGTRNTGKVSKRLARGLIPGLDLALSIHEARTEERIEREEELERQTRQRQRLDELLGPNRQK